MPAETSFVKAKYALSTDEIKGFPGEVSEAGAKTIDKYLEEHNPTVKKYSGSATLKTGELAVQEKTGETFTLPSAATANQQIAIFCKVAELKITSASETFGPGFKAAAWKLTTGQAAVLQSDGVVWLLMSPEYKHEQTYSAEKAFTKAEGETGFEPSATREAYVVVKSTSSGGGTIVFTVGAITVATEATAAEGTALPLVVPAGVKWKLNQSGTFSTLLR